MDAVRPRAVAITSVLAMLCLTFAVIANAQGTGTIRGTVYDNVGVVPGASVTATNATSGAVRTTTTNEVGLFSFAALTPGPYTIKVEVQGFKPLTIEQFNLIAETR